MSIYCYNTRAAVSAQRHVRMDETMFNEFIRVAYDYYYYLQLLNDDHKHFVLLFIVLRFFFTYLFFIFYIDIIPRTVLQYIGYCAWIVGHFQVVND